MSRWLSPLFVCLTALLLVSGCTRSTPPSTNLPSPDAVNGVAALKEVSRFVAVGPRVSGSPGASRAAAYISARLRGTGYRPLLDAFSANTPSGDIVFANVIGVPPGMTGATVAEVLAEVNAPLVILLSHYDTKSGIEGRFVGANDSGSSTGLLLHLAKLLADQGVTTPRVMLAFVDGEECQAEYGPRDGLHGSRHLADQVVASGNQDNVCGVIVLDMIGDKDLNVRIPTNVTRAVLRAVFKAAEAEGVRAQFGISRGAVLDDHVPFLNRTIPAINLIDFEFGSAPGLNDYWHTEADTMDKLSAESLETVGRVVLRMLPQLAQSVSSTAPLNK